MKKGKLLAIINEGEKAYLTNVNDDSFFDGHKFVEYGKNIPNVSLIPTTGETGYSINKDKLVITWGVKFEFVNAGIEGVHVSILNLEASLQAGDHETEINFAEYTFNVIKEKNPESKDVQIFIDSIEIDAEQRIVNVVVTI